MSALWFIVGPTASGKSALAAHLAARLSGSVVNADAFQVYRGLEILSAAPSAEELATAPHQLFSFLPCSAEWDAQQHLDQATPILQSLSGRGKDAIVSGGSGLYVKFLSHGPSELPAGDPTLRAQLDALSQEELVARFQELDPTGAAQTNLTNRRYVTRNLEICLLTGRPMSALKTDWQQPKPAKGRGFVLVWERELLAKRIAQRTQLMLDQGAIEEVVAQPNASITCRKAIGFSEIQALLRGELTREQCLERITIATRQYAKRQRTWFQREAHWLTPLVITPESKIPHLIEKILSQHP